MDLSLILSVSSLPGLFKMIANRSNGLIVEDLDSGKSRFVSARKHQFTPLESISIYTLSDTIPLKDVFKIMQGKDQTTIPVKGAKDDEIKAYFKEVLPEYDEDRVYPKDMKKLFRWYVFLRDKELLVGGDEEE